MISVVIPTYNRLNNLKIVLSYLDIQSNKDFEVIISDQASDDGTEKYIMDKDFSFEIKYCKSVTNNSEGSRSHTRNFGVLNMNKKSTYIIFLDSDIIVNQDYIQNIYNILEGRNIELIFGKVDWLKEIDFDPNNLPSISNLKVHVPKGNKRINGTFVGPEIRIHHLFDNNIKEIADPRWSLFHNAVIKKTIFEKIGGFDESYKGYGYEDMDFGMKLNKNNIFAEYCSEIYGFHIWHAKKNTKLNHFENQYNLMRFILSNGMTKHFYDDIDWSCWWFYSKLFGGKYYKYKDLDAVISYDLQHVLINPDMNYFKHILTHTTPHPNKLNNTLSQHSFFKTPLDDRISNNI